MLPTAQAADTPYTDISGHWAESYIRQVAALGLFSGTSATTFSPEQSMTRGMFVTVLARLAGISSEDWTVTEATNLFSDVPVNQYYAPCINWAVRYGVAKGTGPGQFSPDAKVTREQMATLVAAFIRALGYQLTPVSEAPYTGDFTDEASISVWASDAVDLLQNTGIISGMPNTDGSVRFSPKSSATRAQCSTIFCNLYRAIQPPNSVVDPESVQILDAPAELAAYNTVLLYAEISPLPALNHTMVWISSDPSVISVTLDGQITWKSAGTATLTVSTCNGKTDSVEITALPDAGLAGADETYAEKCQRIFGQQVDDPRTFYATQAEAESQLQTITVKVWDFNSLGVKVTRTFSLTVHKNIAATAAAIFAEIYALPSQPPIHALGGYRWAGKSEHTPGLAIDINAEENYYCTPDGTAIVGSFFDPAPQRVFHPGRRGGRADFREVRV
jgi:hypothetical protein